MIVSLVRPFPAVGSHVSCNAARLRKLSIANSTVKRFLAAVRSTVCCQVGRLGKGFVAIVTPVRSFA
jgi:hypothetical protein